MASYLDKTGLISYDSRIKDYINNKALSTNHPNLLNCTNMGLYNWDYITTANNSTWGYDNIYIGHQQWGPEWGRQGLYFADTQASSGSHDFVVKFNNYIYNRDYGNLYLYKGKKYQLSVDMYVEPNSSSITPVVEFWISYGDDSNFDDSAKCVWKDNIQITTTNAAIHTELIVKPDKDTSSPAKIYIVLYDVKACHFWDLMLREYDEVLDTNTKLYLSWTPNPLDAFYRGDPTPLYTTWHQQTLSEPPSDGLKPYIMYDFGTQTNLVINLNYKYIDNLPNNIPKWNFFFQFTNPSDSTTTLTIPSDWKWVNGEIPTWEPGDICQVSMVNYCVVLAKFK